MAKFGRELWVRTLSGVALAVIVVAAVLISQWTFMVLLLAIGLGCLLEFYKLSERGGASPVKWYGIALGALAITAGFMVAADVMYARVLTLLVPLSALVFVIELYREKKNPVTNVSVSLGGLLYTVMPMILLALVAFAGGSYNPWLVLAYIFIVWVNDIFAYLTGVAVGKHKLFERISPKKSWEGFFGGFVFAVAFAVLCGYLMGGDLMFWGGLGAVIVVSAVFGDLVESMFKRSVAVKDSGNIIPGHGGLLDRFDALIFSVPFVFLYFTIFVS